MTTRPPAGLLAASRTACDDDVVCRLVVVLIASSAGCGRIGFVPLPGADGQGDGNGLGPFGPPSALELESSSDDIVPSLRADELEIMFASKRATSYFDLFDATRPDAGQPFTNLQHLVLTGATGESEPALSDDGLQLYFRRNSTQLAYVDRAALGSPWSTPTLASELVGFTGFDYIGDVRAVMSDEANGELYESTRADRHAAWDPPRRIDELAMSGVRNEYPTASADGLELFCSTTVTGVLQLARATRTSIGAPFGPLEVVDVGFPSVDVGDPELSHDGHTLLFVARNGASGDFELYAMTR